MSRFAGCATLILVAAATASAPAASPPAAAGYDFTLRENGRDFRTYLWAQEREVARTAVAALNTLRVVGS